MHGDISEGFPKLIPRKISKATPGGVLEDIHGNLSNRILEEVRDIISDGNPGEISSRIAGRSSEETAGLEEFPKQTLVDYKTELLE